MQKEYVKTGMIVQYSALSYIVTEVLDRTAKLWLYQDRDSDLIEAPFSELHAINSQSVREFNRRIFDQSSKYTSKFTKNDDSFTFESGEHVFFTSDTHFGHDNIIRFCDRPFGSVAEMDEALIANWNSVIGPDDTVFHLGDFAWGGSEMWNNILSRLNGHIHLIVGNHDVKNLRQGYMKYFDSVSFQKQITVGGQQIYLNHYPFLTYGGIYRSTPVWQLFGHVHSKNGTGGADSARLTHLLSTQYDVGVDNNNYTPVSFAQVYRIMEAQKIVNSNEGVIDAEREQLKLKVDILTRMLTLEQRKQYDELTVDKGE